MLVSFILLSYNQEKYIEDAVKSVLNQDYENLEILISDDCSTDNTFNIISKLAKGYSGKHKLLINRNSSNQGLSENFSRSIKNTSGEIIVVGAGDDIALPNRVRLTAEILNANTFAKFVSFTDFQIDKDGCSINKKRHIDNSDFSVFLEDYLGNKEMPFSGASRGFRREIFEVYGDLRPCCPTEDTPLILRGLMLGGAIISSRPAILYRIHEKNLSRPDSINFMNFGEIKEQYMDDARKALALGIISDKTFSRIKIWAECNFVKRTLLANLYSQPFNPCSYIKLLSARMLTFRDKLYVVIKTLKNIYYLFLKK